MCFNLENLLKALLFSTAEPLSIRNIQTLIARYHESMEKAPEEEASQVPSFLTTTQIREGLDRLAQALIEKDEVYRLLHGPSGYRLTTAPAYATWIRLLRKEPKPVKLSQAAMETLAIIAYRQPVTRAEIEAIRGVATDSTLHKLIELELAYGIGRADLPGRPIQYGTTPKFLEHTGIHSLEELPTSDILSPTQVTEWIQKTTQREQALSETHLGLPDPS